MLWKNMMFLVVLAFAAAAHAAPKVAQENLEDTQKFKLEAAAPEKKSARAVAQEDKMEEEVKTEKQPQEPKFWRFEGPAAKD